METQEQKIVQCGIIHKKKKKIRKVCHFMWYKFYCRITLRRWYHHIQHKCGNTQVHFHKLSAAFPFLCYQFLPVINFLILIDQEQMLKTHLPLDAPTRKNHRVRLGLQGSHNNAVWHAIRWSPNVCFKHWISKLVVCRVAPLYWNQVCFRTTRSRFNPEKKFSTFLHTAWN